MVRKIKMFGDLKRMEGGGSVKMTMQKEAGGAKEGRTKI